MQLYTQFIQNKTIQCIIFQSDDQRIQRMLPEEMTECQREKYSGGDWIIPSDTYSGGDWINPSDTYSGGDWISPSDTYKYLCLTTC